MATRYFALIAGIVYLLVGVIGFLATGLSMDASVATAPRLLGLFPVNALHNVVHLAIGLWGIAAYRSFAGARAFARALAVLYALLAIMGLIPGLNTTFGLIPIFGLDVVLHALTAIVAAYFGWAVAPERAEFVDASRRH